MYFDWIFIELNKNGESEFFECFTFLVTQARGRGCSEKKAIKIIIFEDDWYIADDTFVVLPHSPVIKYKEKNKDKIERRNTDNGNHRVEVHT